MPSSVKLNTGVMPVVNNINFTISSQLESAPYFLALNRESHQVIMDAVNISHQVHHRTNT
jgi:hypothetical protein